METLSPKPYYVFVLGMTISIFAGVLQGMGLQSALRQGDIPSFTRCGNAGHDGCAKAAL